MFASRPLRVDDPVVDGPDRPVDEPDLATWAWHRAAGAAAAVLTAAALGLVLGPGGAASAAGGAAAVVYVLGPTLAAIERRLLRGGAVTRRRLRRVWVALATAAVLGTGAVLDASDPGGSFALVAAVVAVPFAAAAAWGGVVAGLRLPSRIGRPLAVAVPGLAVAAGFVAAAAPTLIDGALVFAVLVVAPAAAPLLPGVPRGASLVLLAAAGPATAGVLLSSSDGGLAAALTLPWVAVTAAGALAVAWRWWCSRPATDRRNLDVVAPVIAWGYLAIGGLWLLADRAGVTPVGIGPPFVQLTAVHFSYAGFAATVLALRARARRPDDRIATLGVVATVAAPPLVAAGFVAVDAFQIVGAVLLTVGTYAVAWTTLRAARSVAPAAAWALRVSAVSVVVPMVLAVQWAVGWNLGTPALSVPQMTATHGALNAVGFVGLGVLGWRLAAVAPAAAAPGPDR